MLKSEFVEGDNPYLLKYARKERRHTITMEHAIGRLKTEKQGHFKDAYRL